MLLTTAGLSTHSLPPSRPVGSRYASDIKTTNASLDFRRQQMVAERDALAAAKHVLVVGGGLVGCEVAGELGEAFPSTRVTLVRVVMGIPGALCVGLACEGRL